MTCHRIAATRAAFEAGTLSDDEVLVRHVQGCDDCSRIVAAAQLDDLGHGPADDEADAVALAALGLGPMPDGVDALDRAFLDDLVHLPAGAVPPAPAELIPLEPMLDASGAAPIADRASALSRPMAMIPPEEMIDPEAPTDARIGALPPARRRWGPWFAAIGTMAAAAVVLFALLPDELQQMDAPLPGVATSDEAPAKVAATPPAAPAALATPAEPEKGDDPKPPGLGPAADGEGADNALQDDPPKPAGDPPVAAEKPAETPAEDEKVAAAPKPSRAPARRSRAARSKPAAAARPAAKPAARPARRPAKKESASEVDDLLGALDGAGGGSKSRAAAPAAPAPAGEPLLPERLTRRQLLTVVKANARSVGSCSDGVRGSGGTYKVEIVIAKSGRVASATVESAQKGSPVAACVERKVRAFRFPQFSGDPMRIMMPFSL